MRLKPREKCRVGFGGRREVEAWPGHVDVAYEGGEDGIDIRRGTIQQGEEKEDTGDGGGAIVDGGGESGEEVCVAGEA